jgi:hypothetical protein
MLVYFLNKVFALLQAMAPSMKVVSLCCPRLLCRPRRFTSQQNKYLTLPDYSSTVSHGRHFCQAANCSRFRHIFGNVCAVRAVKTSSPATEVERASGSFELSAHILPEPDSASAVKSVLSLDEMAEQDSILLSLWLDKPAVVYASLEASSWK